MVEFESIKLKRNLTALIDFSRLLNSSFDIDFILNNILLTCMGKFLTSKGFICINNDGRIEVKTYKGIPDEVMKSFPVLKAEEDLLENKELKDFLEKSSIKFVEKIQTQNSCLGILCLGDKLNKIPYSEDDKEFLRTIINISSTAIQNSLMLNELKRINKELDSRVHRLNTLFELSKEFGLLSESAKVAKLLIYSVIGQFLVSKYAVLFFEDDVRVLESNCDNEKLLRVLKKYDLNSFTDSIFEDRLKREFTDLSNLGIELIVPMQLQGVTRGLILLSKRITNLPFTFTDAEYIYSAGVLAIISLENRRLFKEALEKQKMEEELEIAKDIQKNLLPHIIPTYSNYELTPLNLSSKQVGGDYYDIIPLDRDSFCIAIADVSGKGVPAALLMANLQAFLKIICKHGMQLSEATGLVNDLITENVMDGKFITFFWGILNNKTREFEYTNAGHNPPFLIRDNKIIKLDKGGMILGVMKTFSPYLVEKIQLEENDLLVLYTDGVTEAKNFNDEEYSEERLESLMLKHYDKSSNEIVDIIKEDVQNFSSGIMQSDDITIVVVKVK